ncbi:uncharacterized protein LOC117343264 [Pecten maximus]|uniref:uncharacterized protein LOC117343264 n=1 Tax=Pecten maximus TaxID=6579 RepID=UPI001458D990|nr:uncharacterized protein LOC117343264 [Pecten maximus]
MEKELKYGVRSAHLDSIPMKKTGEDNVIENESNSTETFCSGIWNSKSLRLQVVRSVCVSAAFMISGWTKGQIGPAFPDIMMISGADLEKGSVFMTSLYTGQLLGSIIAAFIYPKINKYLVFGSVLVLYSLAVAAIPWCFLYELMVAAFAFLGVWGGINSVGVGAECVAIWGPTPRGRSYIMANSAAYTISSVLAPLVTAPFLKQPVNSFTNTNTSSWNVTFVMPIWINRTIKTGLNDMDIPIDNSTLTNGSDSKLYIAYTISSVFYGKPYGTPDSVQDF